MPEYRQKLQGLLRELFQFDSADLDFGIYAVMNHKRDQVERFIEHDLLDAIEEGLKLETEAVRAAARTEFEEARARLTAAAGDAALDAHGNVTPTVKTMAFPAIRQPVERYEQARTALEAAKLSEEMEAQVYNDLYRFLSRYYDDGDFISQRRYGAENKYAIPYNGEEVTLYWANADQYYVKSGEYFTDYRFTLDGALGFEPATVAFKLRAASVEQNNVKGEKRFFLLAAGDPVTWEAGSRILTVDFEYRPLADDERKRLGVQKPQEKLIAEAEPAILTAAPDPLVRERLGRAEGEKGKSVLARHLARYTARNTRDFFIHKDLHGFLTRELDYFLKSEVLNLDDVDWGRPDRVGLTAARLQTIRQIAGKIIAFLAQIEDFQRRLWEKRKFVVQSDYCVTLDRVPEALYGEIAANDRQRAEWARLYGLEPGLDADLREHPFIMVDTAFFDADFKARLLASFEDLDAACDGLLVRAENYGALRLLLPRYREQVKCIYIDPPYNTGSDDFIYKDNFQHSSWVSMMHDRLLLGHSLLSSYGSIFVSIDDSEQSQLKFALDSTFGEDNFVAMVIWQKVFAPKNTAKYFSEDHDYVAVCAKDKAMWYPMLLPRTEEADARYSNPDNDPRDVWSSSDLTARNYYSEGQYEVVAPCGKTFRPALGTYWRVKKSKFEDLDRDKRIWWGEDGCNMPRLKRFLNEVKPGIVPQTLWKHEDVGNTQEAKKELLATVKFTRTEEVLNTVKPTRLIRQILRIGTDVEASAIALDFFAGSGTTGHAVINQNRADNGDRRYILVEMGSHFDTMLKPRLQRVIYANDWKDALPVPGSPGQSHMFHYICPESYEDTLNNLRFRELEGPLLDRLHDMPDYFLHYMLEFETQGSPSLLDARRFERPFDYRLNITRGGVTAPQAVDLVTTFNFLLGLRVRTIRRFERDGAPVVRVTGEDGTGRRVCVLWRDAPPPEAMEAEKDWLQAHVLGDVPCDLLYVNGESALLGALPVEPEFHRLMFEGVS